MATVDQLKPILNRRFEDALNKHLGNENRTGGMRRLADDLGVAYETVRSWCYGETSPGYVAFVAMCDLLPGFEDRVRGGISPSMEERTALAEERIAEAREHLKAGMSVLDGGKS